LDMLQEEKPDIVFLDLNMPVMDGIQTLKKIRENNKTIPVIIISAYADQRKLAEVEPYGFSGVFYKGEEFEKSLALLEAVLRTHKKLQE
ncbi:MAG: response regulator, partial [Candidatus Omnitrophota bacterium]